MSALNRTLLSPGHGTLISWKEFQIVCQGKQDILVHFDYKKVTETKKYNRTTRDSFSGKVSQRTTFRDLKAEKTICMNVFEVDSVERFENDVTTVAMCWLGSVERK